MSSLDWPKILKSHATFADLTDEQVAALLAVARDASYAQDEDVIVQGETGDDVFIIGSGSAFVTVKRPGDEPMCLRVLRSGDFFGEIAAIEQSPRSATVTAREPLRALKVPGSAFLDILKVNPSLEARILVTLAEEVRSITSIALTARVDDVSERFEEINRKMDYELKAIDAQLKAAQSLYDNTKLRTDEIINSAQRSRTMLNLVVGAAVAAAGLLGLNTLVNITSLSDKVEKANELYEEVQKVREDVEEDEDKADALASETERYRDEAIELVRSIRDSQGEVANTVLRIYEENFRNALAATDPGFDRYYTLAQDYVKRSYRQLGREGAFGRFVNVIIDSILSSAETDRDTSADTGGISIEQKDITARMVGVLHTMWADALEVGATEAATQAAILWTYLQWPTGGRLESARGTPLAYLERMSVTDRQSAFQALAGFLAVLHEIAPDDAGRFEALKRYLG